jgi:hypothetical protein
MTFHRMYNSGRQYNDQKIKINKKTQQLMVHKTLQGRLKIEQDELKNGVELSYTYGSTTEYDFSPYV